MFAEKYLKAGILASATLAILTSASQPSLAQSKLQTPRGDQTVAPSQMPQQPSLAEDFANPSKQNSSSVAPAQGPDYGGIPGVQMPGRKATNGPGMVMNGNGDMSSLAKVKEAPTANGLPRAETPVTGGLVLPEGVPSSIRIGPVEPVPVWQRATLALWLSLELVVLAIVAVGMTVLKKRDIENHDGHLIRPDTTKANFGGTGSRL